MIQSTADLPSRTNLLQAILDTVPVAVLIVDGELGVNQLNAAARRDFTSKNDGLAQRAGEIVECVHAAGESDGCGSSGQCKGCAIRQAVSGALDGQTTFRRPTSVQAHYGSEVREVHLRVTAAPVDFRGVRAAVLIIEDVSELTELRSLLPLCASCGRDRNDETYRKEIDLYLSTRPGVDFSHCLCPDCRKQLLKESGKK